MVMDDGTTTYQRLAAPFAVGDHAKVNKGGRDQTYVPWTDYVIRLNDVLGANNWSFRVVREGFTDTECWVLAEVSATIDGKEVVRQHYGCEPISKGRDAKPTTDLLKSTASDALKKAASLLGPGLYLSDKEEREAVEAAMRAEIQAEAKRQAEERAANRPKPVAPVPAVTPEVDTAARLTGAPVNQQVRWARLVAEAERLQLPTLGTIKAIDAKACGEAQMKRHADRLEARLFEVREAGAA